MTENGDGTFDPRIFFTTRVGRSCERRFGRKTQVTLCCDDALPEGNRTDVALPHCAQGHDDPLRPFRHTALIMMWHHAGIHEGRSGIAIFMTEIRTDELALVIADSRSEEHTSELQSLMRISYAVFFLKTKMQNTAM